MCGQAPAAGVLVQPFVAPRPGAGSGAAGSGAGGGQTKTVAIGPTCGVETTVGAQPSAISAATMDSDMRT